MSDANPQSQIQPESNPDANPEIGAAERSSAETVTLPAAEFEALRSQVVEWKERCARQQAEFDNVRKRLRKEADEAGTRAVARFVRPLLDQIDNLERALDNTASGITPEFLQGIQLIRENFASTLASAGIESVAHEGAFDPAVHEVIAEMPSTTVPKGHIVQVHRRGYRLKDQLVRTAQVVVAKPETAPPA